MFFCLYGEWCNGNTPAFGAARLKVQILAPQQMKIFLPKKISWLILTFFFTFDAVVSYIAVTRMNGREADLLIAFAVEKYPLLYFATIP